MVQDEPAGGDVVAKRDAPREKKPNFFLRIVIFIRQVFAELRKVVTPTRQELLKFTAVVLGVRLGTLVPGEAGRGASVIS
jgi:preprotein translocase subunit SecE